MDLFEGLRRSCCSRDLWRVPITIGLERFSVHLVERRNVVVPFEKRGGGSNPPDGARVHVPDWIENWVIVRVECVFFKLRMTSDVNLRDTVCRDVVDVFRCSSNVILFEQKQG